MQKKAPGIPRISAQLHMHIQNRTEHTCSKAGNGEKQPIDKDGLILKQTKVPVSA